MKKFYLFLLMSLFSVILVTAQPNTGLQFSGDATSFIDLGQQAALSSPQFTIETWVNYQSLTGGYIMSNEGWTNETGSEGFSLRTGENKLEFVLGANTGWPALKSSMELQVETWYHIAATYSGTEMKLYINGILDNESTITTPMVISTQNLSIGEGSMWKGRLLRGKLSDLRFWNVVRTDEEIMADQSNSLTGNEAGLVANWKMNEGGTSETIADLTGNNNIAKPADVAWFSTTAEQPITVVAPTTGLVFNGAANSFVDLGAAEAIASPAEFTVEALVNYSSTAGGYIISSEGAPTGATAQGFSLRLNGDKLDFTIGANEAWVEITDTVSVPLNTWIHVAATYSATAMKLYMNGSEVASLENPAAIGVSTQNVFIGEGSMWKGRALNGKLGYVRMWSVAKTKQEIRNNANQYVTGTEDNLLASWNNTVQDVTTLAEIKSIYPGTIGSDVTWFAPAVEQHITVVEPTQGLIFNGAANSLVDLGAAEAIASPAEFTVEALVNYSSTAGGYILSSEGAPTGTTAQGFSLRLNGDKLDFTIGANEAWVGITDVASVPLNTWIHVAATYSASAMKLYINGLEVASRENPAAIGVSTQNVFIGEGSMWKGRGLNGKLGYIRMWSVAKTKQEIIDNANLQVTGTEDNLLAAWNNTVSDATTLAEIKSLYPGVIGSDVTWFSSETAVKSVYNNSADIKAIVFGHTLRVSNETNSSLKWAVYSFSGQKVLEGFVRAGDAFSQELNLNGSYILRCVAENGSISTKKFILTK